MRQDLIVSAIRPRARRTSVGWHAQPQARLGRKPVLLRNLGANRCEIKVQNNQSLTRGCVSL